MTDASVSAAGIGAAARHRSPRVQRLLELRWVDVRWVVLLALAVVVVVAGYIGWGQYYATLHEAHPEDNTARWSDCLYHSLMLFLPGTAPERPRLPWLLDGARFLGPAVAGYAALAGLTVLFRDRAQQIRIPFMGNHVVVCGLGYVGNVFIDHIQGPRGLRRSLWTTAAGIPERFRRRAKMQPSEPLISKKVVVIERDPANPLIDVCRRRGVPVIIGDAQSPETLRAAGIRRAAYLLAVTDQDAINSQIVAVAREVVRGPGRRVLHCVARLVNPQLCSVLFSHQLLDDLNSIAGKSLSAFNSSSVDYFNLDEIAAQRWLERFPFFEEGDGRQPHLLVGRLDELGRWLIRTAARLWSETSPTAPMWISVIDDDAAKRLLDLRRRHPELEQSCRFGPPLRARAYDLLEMPTLHARLGAPPLTGAYVTAHDDEIALDDALALRQYLDPAVPLVVALSRLHGVATLIRQGMGIKVFPTLDQICTKELLVGGSYELFARALHERWRRMERDRRRKVGEPGEPEAWDDLDESRRNSNFAQARHIKAKLSDMRCAVTRISNGQATKFEFEPHELEKLAYEEHERFNKERFAAGWTHGEKNADLKTSPYLVAFEELPPEIAEYDRIFVREIPGLLASVGFRIVRRPPD